MKSSSPVYVVRCHSYDEVEKVLSPVLLDILPPLQNKKVLIKPNILSPLPPERGVTTHPEICRVIIECVLKKGGNPLLGDSAGVSGYGATEKAAEISGVKNVAGEFYVNFSREVKRVRVKSRFFKTLSVASPALEADYVINVPKFKTHSLTGLTGGIKNMFGIVVGGDKARVHSSASSVEDFAEAIVDIFSIRPPDLTIMDGIVGMEGNGPSSGVLRNIGYILISKNAVNLDAVMALIMNKAPHSFPLLEVAENRKLGEIEEEKLRIEGDWEPLIDFKMPSTYKMVSRTGIGYLINRFIFPAFTSKKLVLVKKKCKKCKICVKECPQGAMVLDDKGFPQIRREKCINCYCCMELCPESAWEFGGLINRWRRLF